MNSSFFSNIIIELKYAAKICRKLPDTYSLAEDIETENQLKLLRQYRCDCGQGYYFGRPMPETVFMNCSKKSGTINSPAFWVRISWLRLVNSLSVYYRY